MHTKLSAIMRGLAPIACGLWCPFLLGPAAYCVWRPFRHSRKGQATVEYLLMLAVVVGVTLIMGILFHKRILGGMFSLVGMVIGAGKTSTVP